MFDLIRDIGSASNHFNLSNMTLAMEKDGKLSLAVGMVAAIRLDLLVGQMRAYVPQLNGSSLWMIPCAVGVLASLRPFAESYLKNHPAPATNKERAYVLVCRLLVKMAPVGDKILQYADKILNVACVVNAVALMAFGFTMSGSIALCGLFLLALKRYDRLPERVERYLDAVITVMSLSVVFTPMNIVFKILNIILLISKVSNFNVIRSRMPASFIHPCHNRHVFQKISASEGKFLVQAQKVSRFEVNPAHVFSNEIEKLFPADYMQEIEKITAEELFQQLHAKIERLNIRLEKSDRKGLDQLRTGAILGRVRDQTPTDVEKFKLVLKVYVHTILKDQNKDNFAANLLELAEEGNACVDGWTRNITAKLAPQTNEADWAVHHVLAKMRGEILKEKVLQYSNRKFKNMPWLELVGKANNTHLNNAVQGALWHRLRTYEGELNRQLRQPSPLSALFLRKVIMNQNHEAGDKLSWVERFYREDVMIDYHPAMLNIVSLVQTMIMLIEIEPAVFKDSMNVHRLVHTIYEAIKPAYVQAQDNRMEARREIAWEAIRLWIGDLSERVEGNFPEPGSEEYYKKWVERNELGHEWLSESGVRLLLWDLGILRQA